jgi:hypothetical protein
MAVKNFPVEKSHILMFARSVGADNPIYADEEYAKTTEPGTIIAPPTFAQASAHYDSDYFLRPKPGQPWMGSGKNPTGLAPPSSAGGESAGSGDSEGSKENKGGGGLHAEQHFEYHRHLKPGDVLTGTDREGEVWEKQGRRAGKLIFRETITEYHDQDGNLVITARGVGVITEKAASQD